MCSHSRPSHIEQYVRYYHYPCLATEANEVRSPSVHISLCHHLEKEKKNVSFSARTHILWRESRGIRFTPASRGLEEPFFQLCCCVSFFFWREIGFGCTY